MSCTPTGEVLLSTSCGALTPQYTTDDLRRRTVQAISFHSTGMLRALPLERPTLVSTPAGTISAELVTFHPDGSLCRVFPLNGKLSGMWTQEDEGDLARPVRVATPLGVIEKRLIGLYFDPRGRLLSLTLWPGDTLDVPTPQGMLTARVGVAFRPDGALRSLEPAKPQAVTTPAGRIMAYDLDAIGICGDANSLEFAPDGGVARVRTNLSRVVAQGADGSRRVFEPELRESLCGDGDREITPLQLEFDAAGARLRTKINGDWTALPGDRWQLRAEPFVAQFATAIQRLSCSC
ncbi:MAG: hypothetical protein AUJ49_07140 [Desulfovibrionaceae bacterium CG1_02_65_16]|nr:MAG: hypothetical protein AUJ49_07140 [Desulfovibrionaceae bacterium CG1_02_65_16]